MSAQDYGRLSSGENKTAVRGHSEFPLLCLTVPWRGRKGLCLNPCVSEGPCSVLSEANVGCLPAGGL